MTRARKSQAVSDTNTVWSKLKCCNDDLDQILKNYWNQGRAELKVLAGYGTITSVPETFFLLLQKRIYIFVVVV